MNYIIPRNNTRLLNQIIASGVLVAIACLILTLFFGRISDLAPNTSRILTTWTWIILPFVWALISSNELASWSKGTYTLLDNSLSVSKKGRFDHRHESLYRYDSILSVSTTSDRSGTYGSINLLLAGQDTIILNYISHPSKQAARIKQLVNTHRLPARF